MQNTQPCGDSRDETTSSGTSRLQLQNGTNPQISSGESKPRCNSHGRDTTKVPLLLGVGCGGVTCGGVAGGWGVTWRASRRASSRQWPRGRFDRRLPLQLDLRGPGTSSQSPQPSRPSAGPRRAPCLRLAQPNTKHLRDWSTVVASANPETNLNSRPRARPRDAVRATRAPSEAHDRATGISERHLSHQQGPSDS